MQENEGELDREQLIRSHIIHEFDRDRVLRNMHGCYGQIMQRFYSRLLHQVVGGRLLDVGCGFGQFGALGSTRGLEVHSIDIDDAALAVARSLFGPHYWHESVYATTLRPNSIDTVVLNDVISHLEFEPLMREVYRLGARRLIVHDSNIENPLLRKYRRDAGHHEYHDFTPQQIITALGLYQAECVSCTHVNFLSLPISGGLQSKPMAILSRFPRAIDCLDVIAQACLNGVGLGRLLAFRFVAVFNLHCGATCERLSQCA